MTISEAGVSGYWWWNGIEWEAGGDSVPTSPKPSSGAPGALKAKAKAKPEPKPVGLLTDPFVPDMGWTTENQIAKQWADAWPKLEEEYRSAVDEMILRSEGGQWPGRATIMRLQKAQKALELTGEELQKLQKWAGAQVGVDLPEVLQNARAETTKLIVSQIPDFDAATRFNEQLFGLNRFDKNQIAAMVARTTQQITSIGWTLPDYVAQNMKSALIRGMAIGDDPYETARMVMKNVESAFNGGKARAVNIVRTEMLDASRKAMEHTMNENADILQGWMWTATLDTSTCIACIAMHGMVFPLSEPGPLGHQSCKCSRTPLTKSWRDLGFDMDGLHLEEMGFQTGEDWFNSLSLADTRKMLGPTRFKAWLNGEYPMSHWMVRHTNPAWRDSFGVSPILDQGQIINYQNAPAPFTGGMHIGEEDVKGALHYLKNNPLEQKMVPQSHIDKINADWEKSKKLYSDAEVNNMSLNQLNNEIETLLDKKLPFTTEEYTNITKFKKKKAELEIMFADSASDAALKKMYVTDGNKMPSSSGKIPLADMETMPMHKIDAEIKKIYSLSNPSAIDHDNLMNLQKTKLEIQKMMGGTPVDPWGGSTGAADTKLDQHWKDARLNTSFQSTPEMRDWNQARNKAAMDEKYALQREPPSWVRGQGSFMGSADHPHMSLQSYQNFEEINKPLRTGETLNVYQKHHVRGMDKMFLKKNSIALPKDATFVRGVKGRPGSYVHDLFVGQEISDLGYTSMSTDAAQARGFAGGAGWIIEIRVPAGTRMVPGVYGEAELILNRGSRFKVSAIDKIKKRITYTLLGG